jgi:hypothetical protein
MNDPTVEHSRRDATAKAAAPIEDIHNCTLLRTST